MTCSSINTNTESATPGSLFWSKRFLIVLAAMLFALTTTGSVWADRDRDNDDEGSSDSGSSSLTIGASWDQRRSRLYARGSKSRSATVTLVNAFDLSQVFGSDNDTRDRSWRVSDRRPAPVPCRVRAIQSDGQTVEGNVRNAPADCAPKDGTNPPPPSGNVAPTANANGPYSGTSGAAVSFSSAGSNDSDGNIAAYSWTFGDGGSSNNANPSHTYAAAGNYSVSLTVTDNDGDSNTDSTTVAIEAPQVNNPPVCAIDTPSGNVTITVGGSVSYSATVSDADNDPTTVNWSFGGGSPGSSSTVDPGTVNYSSAGVFTTTLTASDGQDGCAPQTRTITVQDIAPPAPAPDVSINSTSRNSAEEGVSPNNEGPVAEQPFVGNATHKVIAINDLGMHCGDLDTRVASILPPFQVLLAQVVQMGSTPQILDRSQAEVTYSAVSNPNDPILSNPNAFRGVAPDGSVFKTNFWEIATQAYGPFYPPGILDAFYDPINPANNVDVGLPVPNVEELYIGPDGLLNSGDEHLVAVQHAMSGMTAPYLGNAPHVAEEFYVDKPFFVNFPFGYVAGDLNWFEGAGVPFAAFDDFGRENPYPLVRVQASVNGNTVATTDTVLPISGEASCMNCHSPDVDVSAEAPHAGSALANLTNVASQLDDPALGNLPVDVSIEYATDINILRLHDQKHGTTLEDEKPVVCQRCHYTPALDLAHVGPLGPDDPNANGRTQLTQSTMSNVMHSHHGSTGLFPDIPAPVQAADGTITNQDARLQALEESCYQCHPGKNSQCLRGAMFNGGMLCSDCHGSMQQVGDDFSKDVSPNNPGAFQLTGNFYDENDPQPRVPWANEPGCGSCHTGDVRNNMAGTASTLVNNRDMDGNVDGIRLRQAFRTGSAKAVPIVPTNKRFAEPAVPASFNGTANNGAGNPQLYRVSTGHGGVMCEGCHGATHAEWPNANPFSNDNITADQLQGHTGTIVECGTCHTNLNALGTNGSTSSLQGPHGMHVVGETTFADGGHRDSLNSNACRDCHGQNGEGSVLSRTAADRDFRGMGRGGLVPKGTPVTCNMCHGNEL